MRFHVEPDLNPPNSYESVLEFFESKFEPKHGEVMPKLLSEFIALLGKEKEEWGGVKAMAECVEEFRRRKKKPQELNDKNATPKDFEIFLFSVDRNVIVIQDKKAIIQGVVDPPVNQETWKELDCPSSSKIVNLDRPKAPNTLKVKIYLGTWWDKDFPKHDCGSPPDLILNFAIHGSKIQKIKVHKSSWGEEFEFPLSSLENDELVVEVYKSTLMINEKFAGTFRLLVSKLEPVFLSRKIWSENDVEKFFLVQASVDTTTSSLIGTHHVAEHNEFEVCRNIFDGDTKTRTDKSGRKKMKNWKKRKRIKNSPQLSLIPHFSDGVKKSIVHCRFFSQPFAKLRALRIAKMIDKREESMEAFTK